MIKIIEGYISTIFLEINTYIDLIILAVIIVVIICVIAVISSDHNKRDIEYDSIKGRTVRSYYLSKNEYRE